MNMFDAPCQWNHVSLEAKSHLTIAPLHWRHGFMTWISRVSLYNMDFAWIEITLSNSSCIHGMNKIMLQNMGSPEGFHPVASKS